MIQTSYLTPLYVQHIELDFTRRQEKQIPAHIAFTLTPHDTALSPPNILHVLTGDVIKLEVILTAMDERYKESIRLCRCCPVASGRLY